MTLSKERVRATIVRLLLSGLFVTSLPARLPAQQQEIKQLVLNIEKLAQFKKILQNMYKGYQILEEGYNRVKGIAEGNFKLHQLFLKGLLEVNPEIKQYYKVAAIIESQVRLTDAYKSAFTMFSNSNLFSPPELDYLSRVYKGLFTESVHQLDAILTVVTAGKLRMSDDERLEAIDGIYAEMERKRSFLRHFNQSTQVLALQRLEETGTIQALEKWHDIKK